jgi:hypothetical protein
MNTLIQTLWAIRRAAGRHRPRTHRATSTPGLWGILVITVAMTGCTAHLPVSTSEAAARTDATLGQSVREARLRQTLNPQAGQAAELPQDVNARRALAGWRAGGGASAGRGTGSSREPGGSRGDEGAGSGGVEGAAGGGR